MKVGFVSDAHGNPDGLGVCLRALKSQGVQRLYFLGDAVGYFPEENAVLDLLRASEAVCLRGNHEALLLGELAMPAGRDQIYRTSEARSRLSRGHHEWIAQWPLRLQIDIDGVRLLLAHGSPDNPLEGYIYPDSDIAPYSALPTDIALVGHTHRPFVAQAGKVSIVNVGSSGMPRDVGDLASCAVFDSTTRTVQILRVRFDALALLAKWGDRIDASAAACLRRVPTAGIIGQIVPA